ncbi:MAG: hypothetical protein IH876_08920 [Gemmatimonadetes bacterium]|nr:hypothetical protein [Gemmatimonadota bacterium]
MAREHASSGVKLIVVLLLTACGSSDRHAGGLVLWDSAGVEIAESEHAAWDDARAWELSPEPLLEIGMTEGDSLYLFYEIVGVHRFSTGHIAVANAGTDEIRFYDADGQFLNAVGGHGDGPSEYRSMGRLDVVGDSLFVSDYGTYRVSVLAPDGAFVRSINLAALCLAIPRTLGLFADGSMLVWADAVEDLKLVAGVNYTNTRYYRVDPNGTSVDSIGQFFSGEHYVELRDGGGYSSRRMPFGRRSAAVVAGNTFYYADGSNVSITQYSQSGVPLRIIRYPAATAPVTSADLDRVLEPYLSHFGESVQRRLRSTYRAMPLPSTMPAVSSLLVGSEGDIWVGQYQSAFDFSARCWWIFAAAGQLLGSKCLPDGFTPHQIGADFVLGVRVDDLGVERVAFYGLARQASDAGGLGRPWPN